MISLLRSGSSLASIAEIVVGRATAVPLLIVVLALLLASNLAERTRRRDTPPTKPRRRRSSPAAGEHTGHAVGHRSRGRSPGARA